MNLESQVTSLELSNKLKELGVPQESLFVWSTQDRPEINVEPYVTHTFNMGDDKVGFVCGGHVSAYTVAELGELLPDHYITSKRDGNWKCEVSHVWVTPQGKTKLVFAETEANARAAMLVYLLENKLITL